MITNTQLKYYSYGVSDTVFNGITGIGAGFIDEKRYPYLKYTMYSYNLSPEAYTDHGATLTNIYTIQPFSMGDGYQRFIGVNQADVKFLLYLFVLKNSKLKELTDKNRFSLEFINDFANRDKGRAIPKYEKKIFNIRNDFFTQIRDISNREAEFASEQLEVLEIEKLINKKK